MNHQQLKPEQLVFDRHTGNRFLVVAPIDLQTVLVKEVDNPNANSPITKSVKELVPDNHSQGSSYDVNDYTSTDWQRAVERMQTIRPVIHPEDDYLGLSTTERVKKRSDETGVAVATIYRWVSSWKESGTLHSLVPKKRGPRNVNSRVSATANAIIDSVIKEEYLTPRKPKASYIVQEVNRRCFNADIQPPHGNTVRNRLKKISERLETEQRLGNKAAKFRYKPSWGSYPADAPYSCYQVDHTPLDIIYVSEDTREPLRRPYLTLVTDVYTRMIAGFYLSSDAPSFTSVGMALINTILPKESYLSKLGVEGVWPIHGIPNKISVDNAKEFRSNNLQRACENFGIDIEWRPVGRPEFGGNVERVIGSFNSIMHAEPGTTKSSVKDRGDYNSSGDAIYTLSELEVFLAEAITNIYHQTPHSEISQTPIDRFDEAIFTTDGKPGVGLRMPIQDTMAVKINFLPAESRTIQRSGIQWDIHYYHDILRPWINSKCPEDHSRKREFTVRRDPRDISRIYFWDPNLKQHFEVPARETSIPRMSIYEYREIKKQQKEKTDQSLNESQIFSALTRLRELRKSASEKTQSARRQKTRQKFHSSEVEKLGLSSQKGSEERDSKLTGFEDLFEDVKPFDTE